MHLQRLFNTKTIQIFSRSFSTSSNLLAKRITTHHSVVKRENDPRWKDISTSRESDHVDVLIVGGGPSGISAAIRLAQMAKESNKEMRICVLEKASEFGGHILSGACVEPRALDELLPNWRDTDDHPLTTPVTEDKMAFMTKKKMIPLMIPPWFPYTNHGNYLVSLGKMVKWLSTKAEELGVELYSGVGGAEVLYNDDGSVRGVATVDNGIHKDGAPKDSYEPGLELNAKVTIFAEGCHGSLTKDVIKKFNLRESSSPQTYSIGLKELWLVDQKKHKPGLLQHAVGWPLDYKTYSGSWMYHINDGPMVSLGLVVSLDYKNPYLNPFQELQRFKTHPAVRQLLEGGERIGYGARALNEGGYQAIPKLVFPGGCLVGCTAGFLNNVKIKGVHTAMKSGMVAAEAAFDAITKEISTAPITLTKYKEDLEKSWVYQELYASRNIRPSHGGKFGLYRMLFYSGSIWPIVRGKEPFTAKWNHRDCESLLPAKDCQPINYSKPDNKLTFDLLSSVALSNTNHDHDEPPHLTLINDDVPQNVNLKLYDGPEQRYCPAGVYEYVEDSKSTDGSKCLQINAQNCIHCKTCDIKDPSQNINWVVPQAGGGPGYSSM